MARLIYSAIASLDGYIEDESGSFDWAFPSEEVHQFSNDLMRPVGTHLYGRRMYEMMQGWETDPTLAASSPIAADFASVWQAADKVVFSSTLNEPSTTRTRIESTFDPSAIATMKEGSNKDLVIGGAGLAAEGFRAGLVDESHLLLVPVVVGGGKPALPHGLRLDFELLDHRRFDNGTVYMRYRVKS